jgi:hypothetical protein
MPVPAICIRYSEETRTAHLILGKKQYRLPDAPAVQYVVRQNQLSFSQQGINDLITDTPHFLAIHLKCG